MMVVSYTMQPLTIDGPKKAWLPYLLRAGCIVVERELHTRLYDIGLATPYALIKLLSN